MRDVIAGTAGLSRGKNPLPWYGKHMDMPRRSKPAKHTDMPRRSKRLNALRLLSLPAEICTHVLRQLASADMNAVCALQRSCTMWNAMVADESLWRSMCEQFYAQPTKMLRAAGKIPSFRIFFVQQAASRLPVSICFHEHKLSDMHWTAEICVAPFSWKAGTVNPPAVALTCNFAALPADGKIMFDSDALGDVRLCTTEQFLEKERGKHSDYRLWVWLRWTVRRADGKGTCVYNSIPCSSAYERERIITDQETECSNFDEEYHGSERWYRDETQDGFFHVLPDGSLTLSCSDGWVMARGVGLKFLLDDGGSSLIEHSADEQVTLDVLNDFEWA